jgi:hypothetical protein
MAKSSMRRGHAMLPCMHGLASYKLHKPLGQPGANAAPGTSVSIIGSALGRTWGPTSALNRLAPALAHETLDVGAAVADGKCANRRSMDAGIARPRLPNRQVGQRVTSWPSKRCWCSNTPLPPSGAAPLRCPARCNEQGCQSALRHPAADSRCGSRDARAANGPLDDGGIVSGTDNDDALTSRRTIQRVPGQTKG